jgi:hypothetical protein
MGLLGRKPGEWMMAAEAWALLAFYRACLAVMPVKGIIERMTTGRANGDAGASDAVYDAASLEVAGRVRWAVEAAARRSWVEFVCFPQTLAGYAMLLRRGVRSTMVYGVMRSQEGELVAHTWLMMGDTVVLGGEGAGEFGVVERWG